MFRFITKLKRQLKSKNVRKLRQTFLEIFLERKLNRNTINQNPDKLHETSSTEFGRKALQKLTLKASLSLLS